MARSGKRVSPIELSLCRRWNSPHPVVAIQSAIKATFPDLEQMQPPIDPFLLAGRRGISRVKFMDIDNDGFIYRATDGDYVVELNAAHPGTRQRFTLAHEIGHTFFFDLGDDEDKRNKYHAADRSQGPFRSDLSEEYLCNFAASELLMPSPQFLSGLNKYGPTAHGVLQLSKEFKTSLWATAWRMSWLLPYKIVICCWQYESTHDTYETLWATPLVASKTTPVQYYQVDRSQPVYKKFSEARAFRGWSWASLGGPVKRYFIDGIALNKPGRLITVTVLDTAAERILAPYPQVGKHSTQRELF